MARISGAITLSDKGIRKRRNVCVSDPRLTDYRNIFSPFTLWNPRWIYQKCKEPTIWGLYADNPKHMSRVAFILSTCQQVPLIIEDPTLLACSIVLHRNEAWWEDLAARRQCHCSAGSCKEAIRDPVTRRRTLEPPNPRGPTDN